MESTSKRFFIPYKGEEYTTGIKGKRVLILGASFYCNTRDCKYFKDCTSPEKKDSSPYNSICPPYKKENAVLNKEPEYAIDDHLFYRVYTNFAKGLQDFVEDGVDVWQRLAFTNYVQFFVPTVKTYDSYLSKRDFEAFLETVKELQPDVIIAWGTVINKALRHNRFFIDKEELTDPDWYIWHLGGIPGIKHNITIVNCYHPSSSAWHQDIDSFKEYLKQVFAEG